MRTFYLLTAAIIAAPASMAAAQDASQQLDDLIPESAVEDPESWAAEGVEDAPAPEIEPVPPVEPGEPPLVDLALEEQLDRLNEKNSEFVELPQLAIPDEVPIPAPLEPEDGIEEMAAAIDSPDLVEELPELAETQISDQLILAFPTEPDLFPEKSEFISRFSALSNIETLQADGDTFPQLAARARADEDLLDEVLRNYGYYDAEILRQFSGGRRDQPRVGSEVDRDPRIRFDIIPGPRYVFGAIDLGDLDTLPDPDGTELRGAFAIESGDPLYADRIIAQRAQLDVALGESGYPFAAIEEPELFIDHSRIEGDLTMPVSPNGRYVFGGVESEQPDFLSGKHLGRIAQFEPGDEYQRSLQTDLRRAILATGLVSTVLIEPRAVTEPQGDQPGEVVLDVGFEKAPLRTIAGGIGYGTEEGVRIEASWEHRNLFPPEGALRVRGILGTREALGSVAFRRNNFLDRDQVLTLEAYASDVDTEAVEARTIGLRGTFERVSNLLFQKPLSWAVGAEVLYSDERNRVIGGIPRPRQNYTIGGLFGTVTWDSSDDLLDPTTGARLTAFLAPEVSSSLGNEVTYLRAQGDASVYRSVGNTVLAGRIRLATIQGAEAFQVAPSRRLYAGGGGSVRGFAFQGVGPRNDLGEPTGGASLAEFSLEARIGTGFLDGAVEVVPFIDAASVGRDSIPDFRFIRYGAGLGLRYKTSFGPIRVDVGVPLNPTEFDSPVAVYVSLGQAF